MLHTCKLKFNRLNVKSIQQDTRFDVFVFHFLSVYIRMLLIQQDFIHQELWLP